jgi:hypothetical protein
MTMPPRPCNPRFGSNGTSKMIDRVRQAQRPCRHRATAAWILLGGFGGLASIANAEVITVCPDGTCDFTDPAAAVASAATGDVVEIAAGIYLLEQSISVYGPQHLVIRGEVDSKGMPATVLDGQGQFTVLGMLHTSDETLIENLVITNGRADYGGGMFFHSADPVFVNCRIENNIANINGAGSFISGDSRVTFVGCEFTGNGTPWPNGAGGAAWISASEVVFVDCLISENTTLGYGAGLFVSSGSVANLDSTRVCGNSAPSTPQIFVAAGGAWHDLGASCVVDDCDTCPEAPACPADLNLDGIVNGADLGIALAWWGDCKGGCAADLDGSGAVNGADLAILLAAWGACS